MSTPVGIRLIEQADMPQLLEAERSFNTVEIEDPDFGTVQVLNDWSYSESDLLSLISQRKEPALGTFDTRTYITQIARPSKGERGQPVKVVWVCGGFIFERREDSLDLMYLSVHKEAPFTVVVRAILRELKALADRSDSRRLVRFYLRDRDEARLRDLVPLLRAEGFDIKLVPGHFGEHDGWLFTYRARPGASSQKTAQK